VTDEFRLNTIRIFVFLAATLMLLPLPVMQYVGEEGLMAIKSYEMFVRGDWLHPSIFGGVWPHSPLWHWPVIAISQLIGWEHVDIAIRLVSVVATWLSAAMAAWFAAWLFREKAGAGWLAALIYLSMGEVAFWYGWLGYVDALFGSFIFSAIVLLWRAMAEKRAGWLILSLLAISLAFMTKNITAYALYGIAGLVLLWRLRQWQLLKSPRFILPALAALIVPVVWQALIIPAGENTAATSIRDAMRNFAGFSVWDYLQHWLTYPLVFAFRALPLSLLFMWWWLRREQRFSLTSHGQTLLWILLGCLLPFWISAGATPRYLVPLYGLAALLLTSWILQLDGMRLRQAVAGMAIVILLKIPYSLGVLPYIKDWRPERDVKIVAEEIMHMTDDAPLRTQNDVATGLAIAAYIDVWRQDREPIRWYRGAERGVYVLAEAPTPALGRLLKSWHLRGDHVYLYWRDD